MRTRGQGKPRDHKAGKNDDSPPGAQRDHIGEDGANTADGIQPVVGTGIQRRVHHEPRSPDRTGMGPPVPARGQHPEDHHQKPAAEAGRRCQVPQVYLHGKEGRLPDGTPTGMSESPDPNLPERDSVAPDPTAGWRKPEKQPRKPRQEAGWRTLQVQMFHTTGWLGCPSIHGGWQLAGNAFVHPGRGLRRCGWEGIPPHRPGLLTGRPVHAPVGRTMSE